MLNGIMLHSINGIGTLMELVSVNRISLLLSYVIWRKLHYLTVTFFLRHDPDGAINDTITFCMFRWLVTGIIYILWSIASTDAGISIMLIRGSSCVEPPCDRSFKHRLAAPYFVYIFRYVKENDQSWKYVVLSGLANQSSGSLTLLPT